MSSTNSICHSSDRSFCPTGKAAYPNEDEARKFAQYLRQTYGAGLQRAYVCPECHQYHLSTTPG